MITHYYYPNSGVVVVADIAPGYSADDCRKLIDAISDPLERNETERMLENRRQEILDALHDEFICKEEAFDLLEELAELDIEIQRQ